MRDYHELIDAGNTAQLEKLKENKDKRGFDEIDLDFALERILDEYIELREVIRQEGIQELAKWHLIRREAADVANFAHMIVLKCDKTIRRLCN